MSWKWEYAFGAEQAARTAPPGFLAGCASTSKPSSQASVALSTSSGRNSTRTLRTRAGSSWSSEP